MRVLVTGGAGYIGSVTANHLSEQGLQVEIIDDFSTGHQDALPAGILCHAGSIADPDVLARAFRRPFDAVIHFAAFSLVAESMHEPFKYYRNNVAGTLRLLEHVVASGVRRFVFSSSAAVYGEPEELPIPESAPLNPVNPYGRTKLAMEWLLADAARTYGVAAVALRYFNAAGAVGKLGEDHRPESHLIPNLLASILRPEREFHLFGDDYPTPDGTCIRDYIHVADLATAHLAALRWADRPGLTAINLGTARGCSVREVIDAAIRATGRSINPAVGPRRAGDPARLVAAGEKARDLLGWRPLRSDIDTILADAWRWHQAHPDGFSA
jgi:UDP-glucose 4-epimerase